LLGAEGTRLVAQAPLGRLAHLDLSWNKVGNAGLAALADGLLPALRSLSLYGNNIEAARVVALERPGALGNLTHLRLTANRLGSTGVDLLHPAACASQLRELHLGATRMKPAAVAQLARLKSFPRLRRLWLSETELGVGGAKAILASVP